MTRLRFALSLPLALLATVAGAQTAPLLSHWETVHVRSGVHANPTGVEGLVWRTFVVLPQTDTPWLRLYFANAQLGKGSYLRIASLRDGDVQQLRMEHVEQWSFSSAYFNGHAVMIDLIAGPFTDKNFVDIDKVLAGETAADVPPPETICGATDDRVPSSDPASGRILGIGCSGWLIQAPTTGNDRLHLTAGHCFATGQVLQFGVPASNTSCALVMPAASLQFAIDDATSISNNGGIGNDYWVFRCFPNSNTGLTTWQTQNAAYALATSMPANGTTLRNYGYGLDGTPTNGGANASSCGCASPNGARNQTQQTHTGAQVSVSGTAINHAIDTCGGNSGSVLLVDSTGVAVAIHTNAGCTSTGGSNSGTTVLNTGLQSAIATLANGGSGTPPANDNCTTATPIVAGANGPFTNAFATNSATAFACTPAAQRDVWFALPVQCTGNYTFTTCTATRNVDTVLEVLTGSCGSPTSVACNDDANGTCGLGSTLTAALTAGQTYWVRVGGFNGAQGNFDLVVSAPCVPADDCATAIALQDGSNGSFSNVGANTSAPAWPCGNGGADTWFTYAAPAASTVTFTTCNAATNFDTVLQVFSGSCAAFTSLGCNDDDVACTPGTRSTLSVTVVQATTLFVRVGGFNGATGAFQLDVARVPSNDDCAAAVTVANGANGPFSTAGATTSQAWPCGLATGKDAWFRYVATCNGLLIADTCSINRNFDTVLEVFGGSCGALTSLGCNDDGGGACGLGSSLSVPVTAGQTYYVRLGGYNGAAGTADLNLACAVAGDDCTAATSIVLGTNGPFSSAGASTSLPAAGCGASSGNDLWFSFTSPCTAPMTFSTCTPARTFDTVLELFGGSCGALQPMACNDDACGLGSRITASLVQGSTYLLRVGGVAGATGAFELVAETGTGAGSQSLLTVSTCASGTTLAVTGSLNIGNNMTMTVSGGTGIPLTGYGFLPNHTLASCGCQIISGGDGLPGTMTFFFGASTTLPIPCTTNLVGLQGTVQGFDVFFAPTGACDVAGALWLRATDIVLVTLG